MIPATSQLLRWNEIAMAIGHSSGQVVMTPAPKPFFLDEVERDSRPRTLPQFRQPSLEPVTPEYQNKFTPIKTKGQRANSLAFPVSRKCCD